MNGKKSTPAIIAGTTHHTYAEKVANIIGRPLIKREIKIFPNGEMDINILETVAGQDVFIIQTSLTTKVNDNFIETILLADALIRARVHSVTLIQLCFPYARKDRREIDADTQREKRCPISAKVIADTYQSVGINRVVTFHVHAPQITGFFSNSSPCENIVPFKVFAEYLEQIGWADGNTIMAGPDIGSAKQTDSAASIMALELALIHKSRKGSYVNMDRLSVIGEVKGKNVAMYDDIADTGSTAILGAEKLKSAGAAKIILLCTHAVFSGDAVERLANSVFEKIIITDSIPNVDISKYPDKFVVLSTVEMTAGIIANLFNDESLEEVVKFKINKSI
jgi:ribose-phosphate pyrophosphokinase